MSIHGHDLVSESEASDSEAAEVDAIDTSRQWSDSEVAPNADATDDSFNHDERGRMEPDMQGTRHVFAEEAGSSPKAEAKENGTCEMTAPSQTVVSLSEVCHLGSMD